jgi:hypothetical protein
MRSFVAAIAVTAATSTPIISSAADVVVAPTASPTAAPATPAAPQKFPAWDTVIKDHKKLEGLFNLYYSEKDQSLLMEVRADQFDKDLISPIAIARGAGFWILGGDTLNFGDQWVLNFRRAADRLHVVRKNVYYKANPGSPQADALKTSYTDSVVLALPIKSEQGSNVLIDLADLYMTDFASLGIAPDRSRSTWGKVKAFPDNVEIEVNAVFPLAMYGFLLFLGQDERKYLEGDIPDSRGAQVTIHYGLSKLPADNGYKPRQADDRVGHFLSVVKDYSTDAEKTPFQRYVTRWHLEKADAGAERSPPKEPILFWIEKSVPREYRAYVKEGILEWNKAFEKVGFIDAIQVRDQQSSDDFDPEDIRFNTFRWITTSSAFAMGPSRTNPLTGQILDADILFDEAMVRYWRQQYLRWAGLPQGLELLASGQRQAWFKLHAGDITKLARHETALNRYAQSPDGLTALVRPRSQNGGAPALRSPLAACQCCSMGPGITKQLGFMAAILQAQGKLPLGGKIPQEYIGQAIKEVTMHEVGHTLGLRHNFKASNMLSLEDCNNTEITSKKGMAGSVMDYLPANIARKGQPQGHYFSPTIGPYDYWAIEYAYKPISGDEAEELKKIARRVAEPDLIFGTDEDMFGSPDPRINVYDLGDPLAYARQRLALVEENLKDLAERVVAEGEGWQRAREAFGLLLSEYAQSTYLAAQFVGSEYTNRDHKGDPNSRPPFDPIPLAKQREAMTLVAEHVLSDKAFKFSPDLLKRLAPEYWDHWGAFRGGDDYSLYDELSWIQRIVLSRFLDPAVLSRIQNVELHAAADQEVLKLPEVFTALSTAIWSELPAADAAASAGKLEISTLRRNLQREHFKRLAQMVLGPKQSGSSFSDFFFIGFYMPDPPADARSLARHHLREIDKRIAAALGNGSLTKDSYSQAHLEELHDQATKVLAAALEANEP